MQVLPRYNSLQAVEPTCPTKSIGQALAEKEETFLSNPSGSDAMLVFNKKTHSRNNLSLPKAAFDLAEISLCEMKL